MAGGVNARKAGTKVDFDGVMLPVFASVAEAMAEGTGANVAGRLRPAGRFTKDSVIEAVDAQIRSAIVITEGVPGARQRRVLGVQPRQADRGIEP